MANAPPAPSTPLRRHGRTVSDSPIQIKESGSNQLNTRKREREDRFACYTKREMQGKFMGPISPQDFLEQFFGQEAFLDNTIPPSPWNSATEELFTKVPLDKQEDGMYSPLAAAINQCIDSSFTYVPTENDTDIRKMDNCPDIKPDGTLYEDTRCDDRIANSDSEFSDMLTEIKYHPDDPFDDSGKSFERDSISGRRIRGQLIAYAVSQFAHQFRTHVFMVFIRRDTARLIRWDRAGAVVTKSFSYTKTPHLADFYSRYTRATPQARGHDTTVQRANSTDGNTSKAREKLRLDPSLPIFKFKVWDDPKNIIWEDEEAAKVEEEQERTRLFYGSKPLFSAVQSVNGRCTRVFEVFDPESGKCVTLKDSWRVASPAIKPEGKIYARLAAKQVRNILTCLMAGDVNPSFIDHRTRTQMYSPDEDFRSHIHYRLVFKEVCEGNITRFKDTKELITVLRDALTSHHDASTKCSLLHRDVSTGNILIYHDKDTGTRCGLLSDWEMSKDLNNLGTARQSERTGTWQFISAALLKQGTSSISTPLFHTIRDDLESFFHVLSWTALQYTHHDLAGDQLNNLLHDVYDVVKYEQQKTLGGGGKIAAMHDRTMKEYVGFVQSAFRDVIVDLEDTFAARYEKDPDMEAVNRVREFISRPGLPEEYRKEFEHHIDYQRQIRRDRLLSSDWMMKQFEDSLKSDDWPTKALVRVEHVIPDYDPNGIRVSKRASEVSTQQLQQISLSERGILRGGFKQQRTTYRRTTTTRSTSSDFSTQSLIQEEE
ncbi:hypothetical protein VKT23_015925 [Stygiomarasmius scandens]|uniref:Fungal-type protein kinase domain-containing protein n=1 Tax=Marasmiellus scandens TaxID=2682957 RepID=A0ABR1IWK7_9AGAR